MNLKYKIKKILLEIEEEERTLYNGLMKYLKGEISGDDLNYYDHRISNVISKGDLPGDSVVQIVYDDAKKFLEILTNNDDDAWFAVAVENNDWEFQDSYSVEEDFKEGYIVWGDLDSENYEKLQKIVLIMSGVKIDRNDDVEVFGDINRKLLFLFPTEMDEILWRYKEEKNNEMLIAANRDIKHEVRDFLNRVGFELGREYGDIDTTVGNLIMWFRRLRDKNMEFDELFEKITNTLNSNRNYIGGWYDNSYEFRDDAEFDSYSYNKYVSRQLDSILEKMEDNEDSKKIIELSEIFSSKYKFDKFYEVPKAPEYEFSIKGIDIEKYKVRLQVRQKGHYQGKFISLSPENFNLFLHQPELFKKSDLFPEY